MSSRRNRGSLDGGVLHWLCHCCSVDVGPRLIWHVLQSLAKTDKRNRKPRLNLGHLDHPTTSLAATFAPHAMPVFRNRTPNIPWRNRWPESWMPSRWRAMKTTPRSSRRGTAVTSSSGVQTASSTTRSERQRMESKSMTNLFPSISQSARASVDARI